MGKPAGNRAATILAHAAAAGSTSDAAVKRVRSTPISEHNSGLRSNAALHADAAAHYMPGYENQAAQLVELSPNSAVKLELSGKHQDDRLIRSFIQISRRIPSTYF